MKNLKPTLMIDAPHIINNGVLEVDAYFTDSDTLSLICHPNPKAGGDMNNKVITTLYRFCKENHMNTVRFNYRGVGNSSGNIEYGHGEFLDGLCVLNWAISKTKAKKLWLAGFSFGGFIACRIANELSAHNYNITLHKLTLIAPSIEKNNPTGLTLPKDTLMIYGNKDEFVSPISMNHFAHQFHIRQKIIPNATHFFHGQLGELKALLET